MCQEVKAGRIACSIIENKPITADVYQMTVNAPEIAKEATPGQFVNLYAKGKEMLLPRPISICEVDPAKGTLTLVMALIGKGTYSFADLSAGQEIEILGPLGNGYTLHEGEEHILVGGGVGTPPLVELAKKLQGKKTIYLGFRSNPYLVEELSQFGTVYVATDDGSVGHHGNVVELMKLHGAKGNSIYACGPKPMLKAVQEYARLHEISSQLSLEERMGCGFGACVGCVCKIKVNTEVGYTYKKVCTDGPVFDGKEVVFE